MGCCQSRNKDGKDKERDETSNDAAALFKTYNNATNQSNGSKV